MNDAFPKSSWEHDLHFSSTCIHKIREHSCHLVPAQLFPLGSALTKSHRL